MLRLRIEAANSVVRFSCIRCFGRGLFRQVGYGWSVHAPTPVSTTVTIPLLQQKRWVKVREKSSATSPNGEQSAQQGARNENEESTKSAKEQNPTAPPTGIRAQIEGLKRDYLEFPDIYNSANAINFIVFTVFCLCSTGSNTEAEWWNDQWGIDAAFRPWAWFLHSAMMNNFLSMTFAMILLHTMCHSVLPTIGSRGLLMYCGTISVVSGFLMWCFNYATKNTKEKQFGPWDIIAGLFVMQYLHQGFKPWQILGSFSGWVKYANVVGAVCILFYDFQPTVLGTALGFALCKLHPRFRVRPAK